MHRIKMKFPGQPAVESDTDNTRQTVAEYAAVLSWQLEKRVTASEVKVRYVSKKTEEK